MIARGIAAALAFIAIMAGFAAPAAAQSDPPFSIRAFAAVTEENFAASNTFNAVFGEALFPRIGGGVQVTILDQYYAEISASTWQHDGDRVAVVNGDVFNLNIPLHAKITPVHLTGGFRFRVLRHGVAIPWLRPYLGAGIARYTYSETCTAAAAVCAAVAGDYSARHVGFVLNGGAEFRINRWVGAGADVEFTRIPGIFGQGGASQAFTENDLGGVAARFRFIVGR